MQFNHSLRCNHQTQQVVLGGYGLWLFFTTARSSAFFLRVCRKPNGTLFVFNRISFLETFLWVNSTRCRDLKVQFGAPSHFIRLLPFTPGDGNQFLDQRQIGFPLIPMASSPLRVRHNSGTSSRFTWALRGLLSMRSVAASCNASISSSASLLGQSEWAETQTQVFSGD